MTDDKLRTWTFTEHVNVEALQSFAISPEAQKPLGTFSSSGVVDENDQWATQTANAFVTKYLRNINYESKYEVKFDRGELGDALVEKRFIKAARMYAKTPEGKYPCSVTQLPKKIKAVALGSISQENDDASAALRTLRGIIKNEKAQEMLYALTENKDETYAYVQNTFVPLGIRKEPSPNEIKRAFHAMSLGQSLENSKKALGGSCKFLEDWFGVQADIKEEIRNKEAINFIKEHHSTKKVKVYKQGVWVEVEVERNVEQTWRSYYIQQFEALALLEKYYYFGGKGIPCGPPIHDDLPCALQENMDQIAQDLTERIRANVPGYEHALVKSSLFDVPAYGKTEKYDSSYYTSFDVARTFSEMIVTVPDGIDDEQKVEVYLKKEYDRLLKERTAKQNLLLAHVRRHFCVLTDPQMFLEIEYHEDTDFVKKVIKREVNWQKLNFTFPGTITLPSFKYQCQEIFESVDGKLVRTKPRQFRIGQPGKDNTMNIIKWYSLQPNQFRFVKTDAFNLVTKQQIADHPHIFNTFGGLHFYRRFVTEPASVRAQRPFTLHEDHRLAFNQDPFALYENDPLDFFNWFYFNIMCGGDPVVYKFVSLLFTQQIRDHIKPDVCPVFISKPGIGKSSVHGRNTGGMSAYFRIFNNGALCVMFQKFADALQHFNAHVANKMLGVFEDPGEAKKREIENLKNIITEGIMSVTPKNHDTNANVLDNRFNIVHTQHVDTIKPEKGCRRFLLIQCNNDYSHDAVHSGKLSSEMKTKYNKCLDSLQNDEFAYRLYVQHMQHEIPNDFDLHQAPRTELTKFAQKLHGNPIEGFLEDIHYGKYTPMVILGLDEFEIEDVVKAKKHKKEGWYPSANWFNAFNNYIDAKDMGNQGYDTAVKFGKKMGEEALSLSYLEKKASKDGNRYRFFKEIEVPQVTPLKNESENSNVVNSLEIIEQMGALSFQEEKDDDNASAASSVL